MILPQTPIDTSTGDRQDTNERSWSTAVAITAGPSWWRSPLTSPDAVRWRVFAETPGAASTPAVAMEFVSTLDAPGVPTERIWTANFDEMAAVVPAAWEAPESGSRALPRCWTPVSGERARDYAARRPTVGLSWLAGIGSWITSASSAQANRWRSLISATVC